MKPVHPGIVVLATIVIFCICSSCGDSGGAIGGAFRPSQCSEHLYPAEELSDYVLPWRVGEAYLVGQGNCVPEGSGSHALGTRAEYAYDIVMPVGTALVAVRDGSVIFVEENFADGTRISGEENTVVIEHVDGTISNYGHLTTRGALVEPGDVVSQGDVVGMSGDSGASTEPHLHFEVLACDGEPLDFDPVVSFNSSCRSVPTTFRNTRTHPSGLIEGESYEALALQ